MTTAILGVPLYGWIIGGVAIAAWMSSTGYSVTQPQFAQFSDPGVGSGPWTSQTTSQTAVPLVFGKVRYPLPLLHYRLDGDQYRNMWLVLAVGEDWETLSDGDYENIVHDIWINDYKIHEMADYTEDEGLKDKDHSWYKFYPNGLGISFPWNVSAKHVFTKHAPVGETAETYTLICTHDADEGNGPVQVKVRTIHEWPEGGAKQYWRVKIKYLEDVPGSSVIEQAWQEEYFTETQTVEAGKETETYDVAGTDERFWTINLPYRGNFKVVLEVGSYYDVHPRIEPGPEPQREEFETAIEWFQAWLAWRALFNTAQREPEEHGKVYLDAVEINDPGGVTENCNFNGTSCLLVRILDNTGELARPSVTALVEGGPNNPAEVLKWLLTNEELGRGIPDEHLDKGAFADVAEAMDAYGYTYNRAICQQSTFEAVQQDICTCGRILLAEWNGMNTPFVDEEIPSDQVPEIDLDNQAVAGTLSYSQKALKDIPNSFEIKYVDSDIDYTLQDLITEDAALQAQVRTVNKQTIPVLGTTKMNKAWELGWYQIQYLKSDMTMSFEPLPILWGTLYPGYVFKALSVEDPLINGTEWMVVGIDETEPGKYVVKATQYRRDAYHAPAITEWAPDVWIPGGILGVSEGPQESTAGMYVTHTVTEHSTPDEVRVNFTVHNIPAGARRVRVYRSYTSYMQGEVEPVGYHLVGEIIPPINTLTVIEPIRYSPVYYRFPIVDAQGNQTDIGSAPKATAYPFLTLDDLPGYGVGDYGVSFYGG